MSRTVLVVGATGRLGVAIARALVKRQSRVVLTARDPDKLASLAHELDELASGTQAPDGGISSTPRISPVPAPAVVCADLTREDAAPSIVEGIRKSVGQIDDIVLACGPFPRTPLETLQREDLQHTLTVHAIAPLLLVHALSADLAAARGAVVALGDVGTSRPYTNHVAYITAKGALKAGLRALSAELAPDVRINMLQLGIVADPEADADPLRTHRLATRSSLGRFGTPEEVVHVVLSLLDATWATGETWNIGR